MNSAIFRAYDIRGNSQRDLTGDIAYKIGFCFAKKVITQSSNLICVGRDGRLSSPNLCNELIRGLKEAGAKVIYIGIVPTPALYFADREFQSAGSIMVTGSHNPKDDNGFKMLKHHEPFFGDSIKNLESSILSTDWSQILIRSADTIDFEEIDINDRYLARVLEGTNISASLKIAFDPGNGSAGKVTTLLTQRINSKTCLINEDIDGNFPAHAPDPTVPKNLQQLRDVVLENNCDVGIGFDGDGDRIGVVTNKGNIIFGDQLLCLFAKEIIKSHPGASIIADVKASKVFFEYVKNIGGSPIMWKTGHSFIKSKMKESGALLAGEMSGHIFFADQYYGYDDAIYAAIRLLSILSNSNISIDEMVSNLPKAYNTPEIRIKIDDSIKFDLIDRIKTQIKQKNIDFVDIDGLRVTNEYGWWLLRASNTEAAIIARMESYSIEGLEIIKNDLTKLLASYEINLGEYYENYSRT